MSKYELKRGFRTKLLNNFRRFFTFPLFENILADLHKKNQTGIVSKLIPPNYLYKKGTVRLATRKGINYKLDLNNSVDHFIYFNYELTLYIPVLKLLKNASVIFDIGANMGITSFYFTTINPSAKIMAFEPHPEMYEHARENMLLNNFKNIELINLGLGEKKEEVKIYEVNESNTGMNRILADNPDFPFKMIKIDRLDSFLTRRNIDKIDFIKIDVEGYELNVLKGSSETIKKYKPVLFIEMDDENLKEQNGSAKQLLEFLFSMDYAVTNSETGEILSADMNFSNCHFDIIARYKMATI